MTPIPDYIPSGTLTSSMLTATKVHTRKQIHVQVELLSPKGPEGPWENSQTLSAKMKREQEFDDLSRASLNRTSKSQRSSQASRIKKVKEGPSSKMKTSK